jgi:hypothetical protein
MSNKHVLFYSTRCRFCQAFFEELLRTSYVPEFKLVCVDPSPSRPALPSWLKTVPTLVVAGERTPRVGPGPVNNWLFERKLGGGSQHMQSAADRMNERNSPVVPPIYNPDMAPRPNATSRVPAPERRVPPPPPPRQQENRQPIPQRSEPPAPPRRARLPPPISGSTKADASMVPPDFDSGMSQDGNVSAYHGSEMGSNSWSDGYSFLDTEVDSKEGYNPIGRNFESLVSETPLQHDMPRGQQQQQFVRPVQKQQAHKPSAKEQAMNREFEAFMASRDRDIPGPLMRR